MFVFHAVSVKTFQVGINWKYDGYISNRYVRPYYADLKTEIMEYRYISIREYDCSILSKAVAFHATILVKSIKSRDDYDDKHGIGVGDVIPLDYLICVILYTDYTQLSTDFSSTFRAKHKYEPLDSIRKRHEKYYWLSKGLRKMMEIYGQDYNHGIGLLSPLRGPFHTGMNFLMNINQFKIKLFSPTSTTLHKEVAIRFGGQSGMLLEFDNSKGDGKKVKGFDFSWISRYGLQEDER